MRLDSEPLVEYALGVSFDDFSEEVLETTKRRVVDSVGVCIGSFATPAIKNVRKTYDDRSAPDGATVLGTDDRVAPEYAALINGAMVRYMDYNDTYMSGFGGCHPSDNIPALLSVAESEGSHGRELVEAIVLAYEIQCRGLDTGAMWDQGFDYVTWGAYGTALAAGRLMGLSEDEMVNALGITATSNNGLLAARLGAVSMWKGIAQPYAQHNGIQACQMARNGVTGPRNVFAEEGGGVFDAVTEGPVELPELAAGEGYRILESAIKPFTCGYGAHPAVSGVFELLAEHAIDPADVESIEIRTVRRMAEVYASPEKWGPDLTWESADHSLPYCVAVSLMAGEMTPTQYDAEFLRNDEVYDLMSKISVTADEELNRYRQEHPRHIPTVLRIETDVDTYEIRTNYAVGHPDDPISDERLEVKVRDLTERFLSEDQISAMLETCYTLEDLETVSALPASVVV